MKREPKVSRNVRIPKKDDERAAYFSNHLKLDHAEILRRAVHVGLDFFQDATLPGCDEKAQTTAR
jgi:hypothetical protein